MKIKNLFFSRKFVLFRPAGQLAFVLQAMQES